MKKNSIIAIFLVLTLALSLVLAGCGNSKPAETTTQPATTISTTAETTTTTTKAAKSARTTRARTTAATVNNANDQGCINDDEAETW